LDELRDLVVGVASLHANKEFQAGDSFGELMTELPEFDKDVAKFLCGSWIHVRLELAKLKVLT
jgi:hypothetical protein